jgi:transposase-like protein
MKSGKQIDLLVSTPRLKQIASGKITEDYRTLSRYNGMLLTERLDGGKWTVRTDISKVRFVNGFRNNCKYAVCEIKGIFVDHFVKFIPKGMKPDTTAFTIEIRRVLEHNL